MRVLVGGEHNGVIRDAFLDRGHYAVSCDFRPSVNGGPHYRGSWNDILHKEPWDLGIFHPTCTFMANSGSKHLYIDGNKSLGLNEERWLEMGRSAWQFWKLIQDTNHIPRRCFENPVMLGYARLMIGEPTQIVQPWWFANDEDGPDNIKKATAFWLFGLPKLVGNMPLFETTLDGTTARDDIHMMAPTKDPEIRRMARSKTVPRIGDVMAEQWGCLTSNATADGHK